MKLKSITIIIIMFHMKEYRRMSIEYIFTAITQLLNISNFGWTVSTGTQNFYNAIIYLNVVHEMFLSQFILFHWHSLKFINCNKKMNQIKFYFRFTGSSFYVMLFGVFEEEKKIQNI